MTYVFFAPDRDGLGREGLGSAHFEALTDLDGANIIPKPNISEVGNGWYKFTFDAITKPFVVGVVDLQVEDNDVQRYFPVALSLRDLAPDVIVNTRKQSLTNGTVEVLDDDGVAEIELVPSESGGKAIRTTTLPA